MEDAPLYKAAFHQRRAERHLKHNRFDEAIFTLEKALVFVSIAHKEVRAPEAVKVIEVLAEEYKRKVARIKLQKIYEGHKHFHNEPCFNSEQNTEYMNTTDSTELKIFIDKTVKDFDARYSYVLNTVENKDGSLNISNTRHMSDVKIYEESDIHLPPLELPTFNLDNLNKIEN